MPTLQSVVMCMGKNQQQIHAVESRGAQIIASAHLKQDGGAIFGLGRKLAEEKNVSNYSGIVLACGESHIGLR